MSFPFVVMSCFAIKSFHFLIVFLFKLLNYFSNVLFFLYVYFSFRCTNRLTKAFISLQLWFNSKMSQVTFWVFKYSMQLIFEYSNVLMSYTIKIKWKNSKRTQEDWRSLLIRTVESDVFSKKKISGRTSVRNRRVCRYGQAHTKGDNTLARKNIYILVG